MSVLTDTNLLLRFAELSHPMSPVSVQAVTKLRSTGETVYTCPQNGSEFWAVATRPLTANGLGMTPVQAETELSRFETLFPMLAETPAIYPAWRRLVVSAGVSGRQVYDARILAIAQVHGMTRLLTFNTKDFTRYAALVPGVQIIDPVTV